MDGATFDQFYAASARRLVGQMYTMTGDLHEAQDCVQEAFVRAWQHRARLDADGNPEGWVRTTAWRLAVSRWRRVRRELHAYVRQVPPEGEVPAAPIDDDLLAALSTLARDQRRAIVLFYLCDLSVADIAAETGATPGTVRTRLSRGRAALLSALRPEGSAQIDQLDVAGRTPVSTEDRDG